jgi:hypothetical protein
MPKTLIIYVGVEVDMPVIKHSFIRTIACRVFYRVVESRKRNEVQKVPPLLHFLRKPYQTRLKHTALQSNECMEHLLTKTQSVIRVIKATDI